LPIAPAAMLLNDVLASTVVMLSPRPEEAS
jgi:hypothetical protein